MKPLRIWAAALAVTMMMPITFWLQYQILKRVGASELMWFLFWVNVPVHLFVHIVIRATEKE